MDYRLGTSIRVHAKGNTLELVCPKCEKTVQFGVFSNLERRIAAKFPLPVNCQKIYFLVCPACAGIFTVDETLGDSFSGGQKLSVGNFDLKELKPFKDETN